MLRHHLQTVPMITHTIFLRMDEIIIIHRKEGRQENQAGKYTAVQEAQDFWLLSIPPSGCSYEAKRSIRSEESLAHVCELIFKNKSVHCFGSEGSLCIQVV